MVLLEFALVALWTSQAVVDVMAHCRNSDPLDVVDFQLNRSLHQRDGILPFPYLTFDVVTIVSAMW